MTVHYNHSVVYKGLEYNYILFDSVRQFNRFVDAESRQLSSGNSYTLNHLIVEAELSINKGTDWYGTPEPTSLKELDSHDQFLGMHLLKEIQPKIQNHLSPYLNHLNENVIPKQKVAYNDRGLGMFSFDRAAMGMFKNRKVDLSTPINLTASQLNIELNKYGYGTMLKKVYAYFENKLISLPSLRLYVVAGANGHIEGNALLYIGLACSELVSFMEERGVAVEVNVLLGSYFNEKTNLGVIRVKRFQDRLDKNQLLLMTSDPRYFRFRGFKALIALSNRFGLKIPSSLGSLEESMGINFINAIEENAFVFEQSYSLDSAAKEIVRIVETYKERIDAEKAG